MADSKYHAHRPLHVVLGAGQVGPRLATHLVQRVRVVRRGEGAPLEGVEHVRADLTDRDQMARAAAGASVIYDTTNPARYSKWGELLAPLKAGVRNAAATSGAFLVSLDNLYAYGMPKGALTEETALRPTSDKGALRKRLFEELMERVDRGELRATVGRASDF